MLTIAKHARSIICDLSLLRCSIEKICKSRKCVAGEVGTDVVVLRNGCAHGLDGDCVQCDDGVAKRKKPPVANKTRREKRLSAGMEDVNLTWISKVAKPVSEELRLMQAGS